MRKSLVVLTGIIFLLEFYVFQAFKTLFDKPVAKTLYWVITGLTYATLLYLTLTLNRASQDHRQIQIVVCIFLIFVLPKILVIVFLLIDDVMRLLQFGIGYFSNREENHFPERRKFLSAAGLGFFGLIALLFTDGIIFGKYRHKVRRVKLKIKGLPASFRGYKMVQISDLHSGSFQNPEKLRPAIDLINAQKADLVLFTGDVVNDYAAEYKRFIPLFSEIEAKDGKFAVLGNHDYGFYAEWQSEEEQKQNVPDLIKNLAQSGFETLRNEHRVIEKNGDKFYVIGVENWGVKPFPQFGDLDKASRGIPPEAAKILMSHDPSHFDEVVKKHPSEVQLTLSGHTHGMQFGLDLKNIKWSPVQYRYSKWADLYESRGKYLYVNRGFGVIAYPGRVGVHPEVTVFELH